MLKHFTGIQNSLLLDEATSALDYKKEAKVISSIDLINNNCTFIIIVHRLSTDVSVDKLYELHSGRIINSGTFDELCNKSESFKDFNLLGEKMLRV